jgi:hypothetical protein
MELAEPFAMNNRQFRNILGGNELRAVGEKML